MCQFNPNDLNLTATAGVTSVNDIAVDYRGDLIVVGRKSAVSRGWALRITASDPVDANGFCKYEMLMPQLTLAQGNRLSGLCAGPKR